MSNTVTERLKADAQTVESALRGIYPDRSEEMFSDLFEAEKYSLLSVSKRIRPSLVIECCRALGGDEQAALPFACAVEMIHSYSLIHDDLPCMDNAELRRGKPSNHKKFGQATALLAGDGLLTDAFAVAAGNKFVSAEARAKAAVILSEAAGSFGMVSGQNADLFGEKHTLTREQLTELYARKTGRLLRVSCTLGALAAGYMPDSELSKAVDRYASGVGLAFQIIDDVLDATVTPEQMGKDTGHDGAKTTFLSFMSLDEAVEYAGTLSESACRSIDMSGIDGEFLCRLAKWLIKRDH